MNHAGTGTGRQIEERLRFESIISTLAPPADNQLEAQLCFEELVTKLSVRFVNLPAKEVDRAIEDAQCLFCEAMGLDRSTLYQMFDEEPGALFLTHIYEGGPTPLLRKLAERRTEAKLRSNIYSIIDAPKTPRADTGNVKPLLPWACEQVRGGKPLTISNLHELPVEAMQDRGMLRRLGTQSAVILPLSSGGSCLGAVTFEAVRTRRAWSELDMKRLRFIAALFSNALSRKRGEEALLESEERLRKLHEHMRDAFASVDMSGRIQEFNPAYEQMLGHSPAELRQLNWRDITPETWHPAQNEILQRQVLTRGYSDVFEQEYRRKDGTVFPVEIRSFLVRDDAGQPTAIWSMVRDITERKHTEQALMDSFAEIKQLKDRLQAETDYLKTEIKTNLVHGQVIGRSRGIKRVLHQTEQVAPADCAVLISGETGTGKELVAQEIHRLSPRKERVMVLVNCAALPSALVESELFGRERGAYTGALTSQVGRFEVANGSTIFLDEVGELSMEVQAKLLRVLQEGEYQRLGSPKTHKVDVRVIAATNRDLVEEVRKGRFREDLYYRLKVFPIEIPPLRDRAEDIPLLVFAFMEEFAARMGKKITKVPRKAMEILQGHSWPGNIRELRNVIEHSVILSSGDTLKLTGLIDGPSREAQPVTLAQVEREHILKTLESTGWRIKGPHGAAARLDLQPSTLYSRMQKLGIPHRRQKDEMATQE